MICDRSLTDFYSNNYLYDYILLAVSTFQPNISSISKRIVLLTVTCTRVITKGLKGLMPPFKLLTMVTISQNQLAVLEIKPLHGGFYKSTFMGHHTVIGKKS